MAGSRDFLPIIEVVAKPSGERYFVDLRELFYLDLSLVLSDVEEWNYPKTDVTKISEIGLKLRRRSDGAEKKLYLSQ